MDFQSVLDEIRAGVRPEFGKGRVAGYIPALAAVPPDRLGLALATVDGRMVTSGDAEIAFSAQSLTKVFSLMLAMSRIGDEIWTRVGKEPSGDPFNSLVLLEHERGFPRNPFINAGALTVTDAVMASHEGDARDLILAYARLLAANPSIRMDLEVAASERAHANVNAALAHLMKSHGRLFNPIDDLLDVYCHQCALAMSCADLARAFLPLAAGGFSPFVGETIITARQARRINALMMTCGMYDSVGSFAYRVGLPAKSGVGGGIVAVVPNRLALAVWSPELDRSGNSYVGTAALELFTSITRLSVF